MRYDLQRLGFWAKTTNSERVQGSTSITHKDKDSGWKEVNCNQQAQMEGWGFVWKPASPSPSISHSHAELNPRTVHCNITEFTQWGLARRCGRQGSLYRSKVPVLVLTTDRKGARVLVFRVPKYLPVDFINMNMGNVGMIPRMYYLPITNLRVDGYGWKCHSAFWDSP